MLTAAAGLMLSARTVQYAAWMMTLRCSRRSLLHAPMTLLLVLLVYSLPFVLSLDNGLAQTPWMGWSAWEVFRCTTCEQDPDNCLSERLIKDTANAMVKGGFRDAGYTIVWIDDCWALKERNATNGRLVPDPSRWPHGLKVVADYVHSLDMQLGLCARCIQSCLLSTSNFHLRSFLHTFDKIPTC